MTCNTLRRPRTLDNAAIVSRSSSPAVPQLCSANYRN